MFRLLLLASILLLQGCGISGAYIYFGDLAWKNYKDALKNRQQEEARDYLRRARDNYQSSLTYDDRRYPEVYSKLAESEYRLTDSANKALSWLKLGLSFAPENALLLAQQGKFFFYLGKETKSKKLMDEAKDSYRASLLKKPLDPAFNAGLMKVFFHEIAENKFNGDPNRNRYLFTQVKDLMSNVEDQRVGFILEAEGILAYLSEDYQGAITALSQVLKLNEPDFDSRQSRFYLTRSFVEARQYKEALELTNQLIEAYPNDPEIMGERVITLFLDGQVSAGTLELNQLEKSAPDYHEFYYRLGKYYFEQNLRKKAELFLLKAYRINSENSQYAYALGENYLLKGDKNNARKFFLKAKQVAGPGSELEKVAQQKIIEIGG